MRKKIILRLLLGVAAALVLTLLGMAALACAVYLLRIGDMAIGIISQLIKAAAIFVGALTAVGAGGKRGLLMGTVVGSVYMIAGYGLYCLFDGEMVNVPVMLIEIVLGAGIGALSGMVAVNLPEGRPHHRRKAA